MLPRDEANGIVDWRGFEVRYSLLDQRRGGAEKSTSVLWGGQVMKFKFQISFSGGIILNPISWVPSMFWVRRLKWAI
jgi:hypothetical protein